VNASIILISLPAIFRGIHLDPLAPGNISYLLWMLMGYLLVSSVLVVTLGRLGDIYRFHLAAAPASARACAVAAPVPGRATLQVRTAPRRAPPPGARCRRGRR
jgi:MFS family permease